MQSKCKVIIPQIMESARRVERWKDASLSSQLLIRARFPSNSDPGVWGLAFGGGPTYRSSVSLTAEKCIKSAPFTLSRWF